jgi:hypothetical protein
MRNRWLRWACVLLPAALVPAAHAGQDITEKGSKTTGAITVTLEDCKATRPGKISKDTSLLRLIFQGPPKENLAKKGALTVDGRTFQMYLPRATSYSITKSGENEAERENASTRISIDFNGNGELEEAEGWYANQPIRVGDRMFDVTEISPTGDRLVLVPSSAPLRGVIEGFRCPPFLFKSEKGQAITRDDLAGRAFLLDIWSVT